MGEPQKPPSKAKENTSACSHLGDPGFPPTSKQNNTAMLRQMSHMVSGEKENMWQRKSEEECLNTRQCSIKCSQNQTL